MTAQQRRGEGEGVPARGGLLHVAAQVEFESKDSNQNAVLQFQALSARRFQLGFHRFNLHRLTLMAVMALTPLPPTAPAGAGAHTKRTLVQGLTLVHFSAQLEPYLTQ